MTKEAKREAEARDDGRAAGADQLRLDRQFCFALYSASSMVTRLYRPLLEPLGLTYPQYLAMLVLWERAPLTVGEIGSALGLDSATLTPLLKRLEASGYVSRRRDPEDERRVLVAPTEIGSALKAQARGIREALACSLPLPASKIGAMHEALRELNQALRDTVAGEG